ncbi:hypothetical protein QN277_021210 [Acacia crassicarpa]|uniref:Uncharacterized protein n=1 Tax=Acacia crassicarpa TaxID=499986 RepID=A0AAE1MLU6_9FABA|nr:hypothetical protein QN277_021210 [Acacia crassicarpa]
MHLDKSVEGFPRRRTLLRLEHLLLTILHIKIYRLQLLIQHESSTLSEENQLLPKMEIKSRTFGGSNMCSLKHKEFKGCVQMVTKQICNFIIKDIV